MKRLKSIAVVIGIVTLAGTAGALTGCKHMDSDEHSNMHAQKYTCSMHPDVVSSTPGKCPKCGMDLVQK